MTISIYIHKMIYKYGGTESFTAKFLEILQELYPAADITMLTECYRKGDELSAPQLADRMNSAYGTTVKDSRFFVRYIYTKDPVLRNSPLYRAIDRMNRKASLFKFQKTLCRYTQNYDMFINCSNQSYIGNAPRNITIIHFPQDRSEFTGIYNTFPFLRSIARRADRKYCSCYEMFMPNSQFTAYWLKQKWQILDEKIKVCYPPITGIRTKKQKKQEQIFACGRIEASKKVDVLIQAFNSSEYLKAHSMLKIAGSCDNEDASYIDYIRSLCTEHIQLVLSPSRAQIEELYAESSIFWHAKGYGESNPMLMEHFGMTTVEAMSAGCIPVVINKGGQREIVTSECGYVWDEPEQLVSYTEQLLQSSGNMLTMREACIERSKMCSKEKLKEVISDALSL